MRILDLLFISVLLLTQIALTVAANKLGALSRDAVGGMLGGVANLKTLAGLAGFAFRLYSLALHRLALNLAQAIPTLQYVCVIVAAAVSSMNRFPLCGGWACYYHRG